jgi:type I restriction enzyme M protein
LIALVCAIILHFILIKSKNIHFHNIFEYQVLELAINWLTLWLNSNLFLQMITGDIKNRIDSIWDTYWVGGITNPMSVLEQMTYLFFMKMLDDAQTKKEAEANILGVSVPNPTFKEGMWHNPDTDADVPYNNLRWHVFKNMEATAMFNTIRNDAFSFIKNLNEGKSSAYSRFMRDAVFLIQNPRTLTKIVDGVDALDMNNRDAMGDVYEYILGKMAASGNNGQFRTPRHIIRMMVELMQPTLKDDICDPAMGSAGFIVESAKYIAETYKQELLKKDNAKRFKGSMFHGFDTDSTMLRIGAMNLMLHGVEEPDVAYRDSLSSSNNDTEKYTLCLANPPFAGSVDSEDINKSLLAITNTKKTELLFVSLFVRMLQTGGRCASIVPDGVLFGNSNAHVALRKELVDNHTLRAVISMPSGVFQPYSGVSTAILIFTKTGAGGTDKVWFYDMQADGYSLDQKRTEVQENDIPDVVARFNNLKAEEQRTRKDKSFLVPVDEIRNNDYVLSINKYKEVEREKVEYEPTEVIMARIGQLENEIAAAFNDLKARLQ